MVSRILQSEFCFVYIVRMSQVLPAGDTYRMVTLYGHPAIECCLCRAISTNAGDIANKYCGRCRLFHEAIAAARQLAEHHCEEWTVSGVGACAVCGQQQKVRDGQTDSGV